MGHAIFIGLYELFISALVVLHNAAYYPPDFPTPVVNPTLAYPEIAITDVTGTDTENRRARMAAILNNVVLASDCFKYEVLNTDFSDTKGLTNQQIYDAFRTKVIEIEVVFFTGDHEQNEVEGLVGYYSVSTPHTIYQNRYVVGSAFASASNMLHEVAHVLGFEHKKKIMIYSVPYQMNAIFKSCYFQMGMG